MPRSEFRLSLDFNGGLQTALEHGRRTTQWHAVSARSDFGDAKCGSVRGPGMLNWAAANERACRGLISSFPLFQGPETGPGPLGETGGDRT